MSRDQSAETSAISSSSSSSSSWKLPSFDAKIVLLGDSGVGKTSIALRYSEGFFSNHINPTIGASFLTKRIVVEDVKIKLQIWDTAGQERFRSLAPMYYRGACAAIIVYDVSYRASYEKVKGWTQELKDNLEGDIVIAVVGNKCDLESSREVPTEVGRTYAADIGAIFCETSARDNVGITELFCRIASRLNQLRQARVPAMQAYESPDIYIVDGKNPSNASLSNPKSGAGAESGPCSGCSD
mmetsp:Transcript_21990/g.55202  ORF Transcript_21990/g.55202 Transcript_21990/m.55202 type:complete len:241 (-) Transcript_21990:409-1131(-)|eukprot:CAMPEP_0177681004 /NCGR_PEP_ID=MMETSP0447-20121125/30478_1 /TAXON_ID=0 /ORGANISM="Stygamoeba regulata, Strain BSH-02190019" /LENGTH=240 /DNA_ID=CAMNT_0019190379 /DNA_START=223 /DNA_END=945 /DNA_ORIENTATION=-